MGISGIEDKDSGFKKITVDIKALRGASVKIGFWGDETGDDDRTAIVDYATYNEFGTVNIPARPFMATTYDQNHKRMEKLIKFLAGKLIDGETTVERILDVLGMEYQTLISKTITDAKSWAEPLADSTIQAKGSSSPLIDQAFMINAVNYEINR